jgi:hypothetical protein
LIAQECDASNLAWIFAAPNTSSLINPVAVMFDFNPHQELIVSSHTISQRHSPGYENAIY